MFEIRKGYLKSPGHEMRKEAVIRIIEVKRATRNTLQTICFNEYVKRDLNI